MTTKTNKDIYCDTLRDLQEIHKKIEAVHQAFNSLSPDFGGFYVDGIDESITSLLDHITNDTFGWTSYFIWELNWGKDAKKFEVTDQYGKKWVLDTPEKVYDLIQVK